MFDGKTRIRRSVADPGTDRALPRPEALSWAAISTQVALSGVDGQHSEWAHGHQSEVITGSQTHHVAGNQTIEVGGKHKETIVEDCYQNIIGPHTITHHNALNETALGACSKVYGQSWYYQDPVTGSDWEGGPWVGTLYGQSDSHHTKDFSYSTWSVIAVAMPIQLGVVQLALTAGIIPANATNALIEAAHGEVHLLHFELHGVHDQDHFIRPLAKLPSPPTSHIPGAGPPPAPIVVPVGMDFP